MALPLPDAVKLGGDIVGSMRATNELKQLNLENAMKRLQNQYYAPNIESEINYRNELMKGQNIQNQYMPEKLQLANAFQQLQNKYYGPNIQSEMANRNALTNKYNTMLPLEAQELRLKNQFYPQLTQAQIGSQNAMADWRRSGGFGGMGVDQKLAQGFNNQLAKDHPDWDNAKLNDASNAYYEGRNTFSDGTPLPPLGGQARDLKTKSENKNAPVAIRNQAANYDVLYNDLNDFDIEAVKSMAGPQGKLRLIEAKAKMAINPNDPSIDPMARRFLTAMNQSIYNMDTMRKAFGTSVVPDYVYKTIGRLTNPSDSIFNDATQIGNNYKAVVDQVKKNRDIYFNKVKKGVTAEMENKKDTKWIYNQSTGKLEPK